VGEKRWLSLGKKGAWRKGFRKRRGKEPGGKGSLNKVLKQANCEGKGKGK